MKKILSLLAVALIVLPLTTSAALIDVEGKRLQGGGTIVDDVYAGGPSIIMNANVTGDVIAGGSSILLTGSTTQDAILGGGNITITGGVGDDLRIAGGNLMVQGPVADDALIAGGQITVAGPVGGDAIIMGGSVVVTGTINGKLTIKASDVEFNGRVNGNVDIEGENIKIGDQAVIAGSLVYTSSRPATISENAQITGDVDYNERVQHRDGPINKISNIIAKFIILLVSALVVYWVLRNITFKFVRTSFTGVWWNLLRGLIILIVVPIAVIIVMITIIGIPLGMVTMLAYVLLLLFSYIFTPILVGALVQKWFRKSSGYEVDWKTIVVGALVMTVVSYIPVVGGLAIFILMLIAVGGVSKALYDRFVSVR